MSVLAPLNLSPALHIFVRNPTDVIVLQQIILFPTVDMMKNLGIQKAIAITPTNISKELVVLSNASITTANHVKLERLRGDSINVYMIEIENLTASSP